MRLVETDHVIYFNESHGMFGTRLRLVVAPYWFLNYKIIKCVKALHVLAARVGL